MPQPIFRHILDNGLTVLLRPMENVGTVSTWIFFRVGARNELPGLTGISHWVEHMAFKGTPTFSKGAVARIVNRYGGIWNGLTYYDWTAYFETLPAEHLELALRIEADRMRNVLMDPAEAEAERTVILSEREGDENDPGYLLNEEVAAAALRVHPYRQPVIGWKEDLRRMTREELAAHYHRYYAPNNAVLVLVGALDVDEALALVKKYFEGPPGVPPPPVLAVEPAQQAERRLELHRPGATPIMEVAFPAPRAADPDMVPFLVLDAVLSGAKGMSFFGGGTSTYRSARLYRALVETGLAVAVTSSIHLSLDPGLFELWAHLRAGRRPEEVEPVLLGELDKLVAEPPDAEELARTVRQLRAQLAYSSESTTAQAYWLGSLEIADRAERLDSLLDEVAAVRPGDVQRVAARYLQARERTVGWFIPEPPAPGEEVVEEPPLMGAPLLFTRNPAASASTEPPQSSLAPGIRRSPLPMATIRRRVLPGGTVLLGHENSAYPVVAVHGSLRAGSLFDVPGKEGMAQATAQMLPRGTEEHSFRQIYEILEGVGAGLEFGAGPFTIAFTGKALAEHLPLLLDLLVELLRQATFPDKEWGRMQGELITRLRLMEDDTDYVADRTFRELLYPEGHLLRRRTEGTTESIEALTAEDLRAFYQGFFHPSGLTLTVSGNVAFEAVGDRLEQLLVGWNGNPPPQWPDLPRVQRPPAALRVFRPIPGKSQSSVMWGVPGVARTDADYYAVLVANIILGQLGLMGRLGATVRDVSGLAYSVRSGIEAGLAAGPWYVEAGVAPQNVERAVEGIVAEVGRFLEEGPLDEEWADTVSYLIGQMPLGLETNDGVAAMLMAIERFDLGLDYVERYPEILRQLTKEEIISAARRYLSTSAYALAVAGPG